MTVLREAEAGVPVKEVYRGISDTIYRDWKARYGELEVPELKRLKELEAENTELKRMHADLALENEAINAVLNR